MTPVSADLGMLRAIRERAHAEEERMRHRVPSTTRGTGGIPRVHQRDATIVDLALVQLIRLVRSDDWSPNAAADHLRAALGSDAATVLRHVRSRVQRVRLDRPSVLADRAIETLDAVLADQVTA